MFRKLTIACLLAVLTAGLAPVRSASAAPPERVELPDFFVGFLDADQGQSAWINVSASDFCLWALGGSVGPAPVIDSAIPAKIKLVGQDESVIQGSVKAPEVYIEVWKLDNPSGPSLGGCQDIAEQLLSGGQPWATGTTSVNARTNNQLYDDSRAIVLTMSGTASITTAGAESYRYKFNDHVNSRCLDFHCDVTNTSLRPL